MLAEFFANFGIGTFLITLLLVCVACLDQDTDDLDL